MSKKVGARKALQFFKDNYIMISSCEAKREEGCAEKCLNMLENMLSRTARMQIKEARYQNELHKSKIPKQHTQLHI